MTPTPLQSVEELIEEQKLSSNKENQVTLFELDNWRRITGPVTQMTAPMAVFLSLYSYNYYLSLCV